MNKEEFLKEHPSLNDDYVWCWCGKQIVTYLQPHNYAGCDICPIHGPAKGGCVKLGLTDPQKAVIHETQLDKQKVKDVIERGFKKAKIYDTPSHVRTDEEQGRGYALFELKKELGLE